MDITTLKQEINRLEEINEFLESVPMLNAPDSISEWVDEQTADNCNEINRLNSLIKFGAPGFGKK